MTKGDVTEPEIDEDALDRTEDAPESQGEPLPEFKGRPKGLPKTGGKVKDRFPAAAVHRDLLKFHRDVLAGISINDPSGTKLKIKPTLRERQHSAEALERLLAMELESRAKAEAEAAAEAAQPPPLEADKVRQALVDAGLVATPAVSDHPESVVTSITDPDAIADFNPAVKETARQSDSAIQLGGGFTAIRDVQAGTGRVIWRCFNERGEFCANKSSPEAARDWFENNTAVGRDLAAKRGRNETHTQRRGFDSARPPNCGR